MSNTEERGRRAAADRLADLRKQLATRVRYTLGVVAMSVLLAAPFAIWAAGTLFDASFEAATFEPVEVEIVANIPSFEVVAPPLAILVLDVSGSMKTNDPGREQISAVGNFLHVYRSMARGALAEGQIPNVSVIAYSSEARQLSIPGGTWAPIGTEQDVEVILGILRQLLGSPGDPERRKGWNTDHLAAAREVGRIASEYRGAGHTGSIGVLFMTDGKYDPSPLLDASLSESALKENRQKFWQKVERLAGRRGRTADVAGIRESFEGRLARERPPLNPSDEADADPIYLLHRSLTERIFGGDRRGYEESVVGLATGKAGRGVWFRDACNLQAGDLFRLVVLGEAAAEDLNGDDVIVVSRATSLGTAFADVLASWLQLERSPAQEENRFVVTPGARALTVVAESEAGTMNGNVECAGGSYPLRGGLALAGDPPPGPCTLQSESKLRTMRAWTESRFRWVLELPVRFSMLSATPNLVLALYRIDSRLRARPEEIYEGLPPQVDATLQYPGGTEGRLRLQRNSVDGLYSAPFPLPEAAPPGTVMVTIRLDGLRFRGGLAAETAVVTGKTIYEEAWQVRMTRRDQIDDVAVPISAISGIRLVPGSGLPDETTP